MPKIFLFTMRPPLPQGADADCVAMGPGANDPDHEELILLLEQVRQRDAAALSRLYDRVAPALFGVIHSVLHNREESEDVLQEVFVRIWKRAGHYDPALGKAISWMITVARNCAYDRARSLGRKAELRKEKEGDLADSIGETLRRQWNPQWGEDEALEVESALEALSPDQREAIELAFFSGMTQQEVSNELEVPLGTVKARIRRGLLKLRDNLRGRLFKGKEGGE